MTFVQHNHDRIFYHIHQGSSTITGGYDAIVFLHSLGTDHSLWKYQFESLKEQEPLLIAFDTRGHGKSTCTDGINLDLWVEDILVVLDSLHLNKVILCGISMGGVEAMAFAQRYPERVGGLILADTFAKIDPSQVSNKIKLTGGTAKEQGMSVYADTYLDQTLSSSTKAQQIRADLRRAIAEMDADAYYASAETCFSTDVESGLDRLHIPTLVMIGDDDQKSPIGLSETIAHKMAGSMLRVVPQARHLANVDNPDEFNRYLKDFLASLK
jgi:3-oxoadipate enol-lactonase